MVYALGLAVKVALLPLHFNDPEMGVVQTAAAKVATTFLAAFIVTSQEVAIPEQPPPVQPEKVDPPVAFAFSRTTVPASKFALQVLLQAVIPLGLLPTEPVPSPAFVTDSAYCACGVDTSLKFAVTVRPVVIMMVQGVVPEQPPPLQPVKVELLFAAADKVTDVPVARLAEQVLPQSMPPTELVTVPLPRPVR